MVNVDGKALYYVAKLKQITEEYIIGKCAPKAIGTGEFRVIQSQCGINSGYLSLIIPRRDNDVVAQKFVVDGDLYEEIFDYIVHKLGGRINYGEYQYNE